MPRLRLDWPDLAALAGMLSLGAGIYLAFGLAAVLIAAGLVLVAGAALRAGGDRQ